MPASAINRSTVFVAAGVGLVGSYAAKKGDIEKRGALEADIFMIIFIFLEYLSRLCFLHSLSTIFYVLCIHKVLNRGIELFSFEIKK